MQWRDIHNLRIAWASGCVMHAVISWQDGKVQTPVPRGFKTLSSSQGTRLRLLGLSFVCYERRRFLG